VSVTPDDLSPRACIVVPTEAAPARLAQLGLTIEILATAVAVGDSRRKSKTLAQYPRNYPGIVAWAETLAELRRKLIQLRVGWDSNHFSNYETVYLLEKSVSIAVAGGDKNTGIEGVNHPRLARKRGPMTTDRVEKNLTNGLTNGQFALDYGPQFEPHEKKKSNRPTDFGCQTWFLVVHADKEEVRIELSLASGIDKEGLVASWIERIMIPSLPVSGAVLPIDPDQDDDDEDSPFVTRT